MSVEEPAGMQGIWAQVNRHQHLALVRDWWMSVELGVRADR